MTKLGTFVWGPITLVLDYFECFVVDGVNILVFEHVWNKGCVVMVKRTRGKMRRWMRKRKRKSPRKRKSKTNDLYEEKKINYVLQEVII